MTEPSSYLDPSDRWLPEDASFQKLERQWNLQSRLKEGGTFLKFGRAGDPHERTVWLSDDAEQIHWGEWIPLSEKEKERGKFPQRKSGGYLKVKNLLKVVIGCTTPVFERQRQQASPSKCFSIVAKDRTLDLQSDSTENRDDWVLAFRSLVPEKIDESIPASPRSPRGELSTSPSKRQLYYESNPQDLSSYSLVSAASRASLYDEEKEEANKKGGVNLFGPKGLLHIKSKDEKLADKVEKLTNEKQALEQQLASTVARDEFNKVNLQLETQTKLLREIDLALAANALSAFDVSGRPEWSAVLATTLKGQHEAIEAQVEAVKKINRDNAEKTVRVQQLERELQTLQTSQKALVKQYSSQLPKDDKGQLQRIIEQSGKIGELQRQIVSLEAALVNEQDSSKELRQKEARRANMVWELQDEEERDEEREWVEWDQPWSALQTEALEREKKTLAFSFPAHRFLNDNTPEAELHVAVTGASGVTYVVAFLLKGYPMVKPIALLTEPKNCTDDKGRPLTSLREDPQLGLLKPFFDVPQLALPPMEGASSKARQMAEAEKNELSPSLSELIARFKKWVDMFDNNIARLALVSQTKSSMMKASSLATATAVSRKR